MDQKERQPMGPGPEEVSDNIINFAPSQVVGRQASPVGFCEHLLALLLSIA